jgi:hypothetical protein
MIENKSSFTNTPLITKGNSLISLWKYPSPKKRMDSNENYSKFKKRKSLD